MQLYLIRHPRPQVPAQTCYGQSDLALAEPVEALAAHLRSLLPERFLLFSSPLQRARILAQALGVACLDARLMELNMGQWELQPYSAISAAQWAAWARAPQEFCPPGGESGKMLHTRVLQWWQQVRASAGEDDCLVVVAHGGPLRALAGHLLQIPPEHSFGLDFALGACSRLDVAPWGSVLRWLNR